VPSADARPVRGGQLFVSIRTEPQTFNRYTRRDAASDLISTFVNAKLVRVNRATQQLEPWLAERWERADDGRRYTVTLRSGVSFADGHPFTADDVVFSFEALYDPASNNTLADALKVGGKPLAVSALDAQTVLITFPERFAAGMRLLDNLPILPKHKLEGALKEGRFASAWSIGTPAGDITGLGPFVISEHRPAERTVLVRNPRYFRRDEDGAELPYLDRVVVEVVPDQNAELLRLESGDLDAPMSELRPEDYAPLKRAADAGKVRLFDLGVAYDADAFWINLKPGAFAGDPRAGWLQRDELRQAISLAVDRQRFADTVYLGAGTPVFGPITPANKLWYSDAVPHTPYDPEHARALLASIGLVDRNGDGLVDDASGKAARFTLLVQKGRTAHERAAAVIRDALAAIGLTVDVVGLEGAALIQKFVGTRDYDAVYFSILTSDTDPAVNQDFWLSHGSAHVWNMEQPQPATEWERRIDELMDRQMHAAEVSERKRLFDEVQAIFAEHLPLVQFAAPKVYVAASARVTNVTPALSRPQLLWAPDTIAIRP
jgi:peptide/nickel transport system substrate-binding protein